MIAHKKMKDVYQINVEGISESDWRAAVPDSIKPLIESKRNGNIAPLEFKIISTQIELLLNNGEIEKATEALKLYVKSTDREYSAPVCRFRRDNQNGGYPFIGGHSYFGAFRDAADSLHPEFFWQKGKKGQSGIASKNHLRKFVKVMPHHVYFYRLDGSIIEIPAEPEGQQPVGAVKGFAYYEVIRHPFKVNFKMQINPRSKQFEKFLSSPDYVLDCLYQSAWFGQSGCRGAGYGMWKITKAQVENVAPI